MGWVWCVLCVITSYTVVPAFVKMLISSDNRKVIDTATLYLRVDSLLYFVTAMITIIRNSLQGIGDRLTPIISSGIELAGKVVITFTLVPFMGCYCFRAYSMGSDGYSAYCAVNKESGICQRKE